MKIASHDTMSYLVPRRWWMRPFRFVARCQNRTIVEQYALGVCMFDMRVRPLEDGSWVFAHGLMTYRGETPEDMFSWLDTSAMISGERIMVRLLLEYNRPSGDMERICRAFAAAAHRWRLSCPHLVFFGFQRKYDMVKLYGYDGEPEPTIYQATSSNTGSRIDDWWPWLYAWLHNRDNISQGTTREWLSLDFIGI